MPSQPRPCLSAVLFLLLLAPAAQSQPARLVRDLATDTVPVNGSSAPRNFHALGDKILFSATDPTSGAEVWVSDGTAHGTEMLGDLRPGSQSYGVEYLGSARGLAFWSDQTRVWRSDGTRAGTFALTEPSEETSQPEGPGVALGGILYFLDCGNSGYCQLWRSDGTPEGTRKVSDVFVNDLVALGDRLYFSADDGKGFWTTDGTEAGTRRLSPEMYVGYLTATGNKVFFTGQIGFGPEGGELWVSDGTEAGTLPLTAFENREPFRNTQWLEAHGSKVYFLADDVTHGIELWESDGTAGGTVRITQFGVPSPFTYENREMPRESVDKVGDFVLFLAYDPTRRFTLWATRGTPETTTFLSELCAPHTCDFGAPTPLVRVGGRVLFRKWDAGRGGELWSTDGTPGGTVLVKDLCPGTCSGLPLGFAPLPSSEGITFVVETAQAGHEIWTSNGTAAGTRRLAALPEGVRISELGAAAAGRLFFAAQGPQGDELWAVGGSEGGAYLVDDIAGVSTQPSNPMGLAARGSQLLFGLGVDEVWQSSGDAATTSQVGKARFCSSPSSAPFSFAGNDGSRPLFFAIGSAGGCQLWAVEPDRLVQLTSFPASRYIGAVAPGQFQGKLVFPVTAGNTTEIWSSDGTVAGTRKLLDLPAGAWVGDLAALGPDLYFFRHGSEDGLWRSDGTPAGTHRLTESLGYIDDGGPLFTRVGSLIFFRLDRQLWKTDGTPGGTAVVPVPGLGFYEPEPQMLVAHQGALYFSAHVEDYGSTGLWRTDGTTAGTVLLAEFGIGPAGSDYTYRAVSAGARLFFLPETAYDDGSRLWISDGTVAGTVLLRDFGFARVSELTVVGSQVYFAAGEEVHGEELWVSDGTPAGTRMVHDIAPQGGSSSPRELTLVGNQLFFTADDGLTGRELWVLPLSGGLCQPTATTLCLGGRFRVESFWRDFAGQTGTGQAVPLTADTGYFWFFGPDNVEVILKVLDGRTLNDHFWVFYGALSNVEYFLTVTDTQTGLTRRYHNLPGRFASEGDTNGFGRLGAFSTTRTGTAGAPPPGVRVRVDPAAATGACQPAATRLCLNGGRFAVEAAWKDFQGQRGTGTAVPLTGDTGYFWFFDAANVEAVVKVLDGRGLNGKFWLFYGALSNVEYTLTVTDTVTGTVKTYTNPSGRFASVGDTTAF